MLVEECRELAEMLFRFRRRWVARILRVRLALEHMQIRDDTSLPQLAMHPHGIGEEQVPCAGCEDGGREACVVAIDWRKLRVLQIRAIGVELRGVAEPA